MKPITDQVKQEKINKLMSRVQPIFNKIALEVYHEDGKQFLPGFNLRVRTYCLDELAKKNKGFRFTEEVFATGAAVKVFYDLFHSGEFKDWKYIEDSDLDESSRFNQ